MTSFRKSDFQFPVMLTTKIRSFMENIVHVHLGGNKVIECNTNTVFKVLKSLNTKVLFCKTLNKVYEDQLNNFFMESNGHGTI